VFCRIVLRESTRAFDREYTYAVPAEQKSRLAVGSRVLVPFGSGNRSAEGYVTAVMAEVDSDFYIKPVTDLLSERPVLLPEQLRLAAQMRGRYLCTYGDALKCMVPAAVASIKEKTIRLAELLDPQDAAQQLADGEVERVGHIRVIELLLECGSAPLQEIMFACQVSRAVLATLEKKQLIRIFEQETRRTLPDEQNYTPAEPFPPTPDQSQAIERIAEALAISEQQSNGCHEFLLFGITGSGKTEVYLQCARITADQGRGVIILVPEISLTPQMIGRIRSRFGTGVAVLHSRLTPSERYEQWQRIMRQEVRVVVGARSAIFAPLQDIGMIVIDEEQETTYKSETHPRYHARDIARLRAHENGAVLVLGSATPSIESYHRAENGQAALLTLRERVGNARLPATEIVDMRRELGSGNRSIFSRKLSQAMREAFAAGHQAMILINRRGYAGFILCRNCGHVVKCRSCSVSLTSHLNPHHHPDDGGPARPDERGANLLICHYCGRVTRQPTTCPVCGSSRIGRFGAGTQQVEEQFNIEFAPYKALRMDQDTTIGRTSHARLLDQFAHGEADALIGTQMIAKGHDFPNVTVSGIIAADLMLGVSDFRAAERAFQLITQTAGRAGRGEDAGQVIIQAYNVDDYAVRYAAAQDYPGFFCQEIAFRHAMRYPPFGSICSITLSAGQEPLVREKATRLAEALRLRGSDPAFKAIEIMEPGRAPLFRIKDRYRWRLVLKGPDPASLAGFLLPVTDRFDFAKVAVALDIDPYQML
jgi:primosomal protein N' (replication factor Y) (superfamily II helicase)